MRVLVTGGSGFIGTHLIRRLKNEGHAVTNFDLTENPECDREFIGDLLDVELVKWAMNGQDSLIHLAAVTSVAESVQNPERARAVNETGSQNLLRAAERAGVRSVVLASSAAIYGLNPRVPTDEAQPPAPASPYAESKMKMEQAALAIEGMRTCILRFFNVYGPGQSAESQYAAVIAAFITAAKAGTPLTIYGDGLQTRDFVSVHDIVSALSLTLTKGEGIINIGSGRSVSIRELARLIINLSNSSSSIIFKDARPADPRKSQASIARARKVLGFTPSISLEEGLRELIASGA